MMKKLKQNQHMLDQLQQYLPNGGIQWLLPKPWTSFIGQCAWYCTSAPPRPSRWPAKLVPFFIIVLFAVALAAARAIQRESSRLMEASSGFGLALDMLHWWMPSVLLHRTCMGIEIAHDGGAFIFAAAFFA
jgi:hypothetical protein